MNLANSLTLLRALLAPLMAYLLLGERFSAALAVLAVAGLTDALDGYVARHFHQVTRLGAFLDPFADKLLIVATVIPLACVGRLPFWLVLLIVGRDGVIVAGAMAYRLLTGHLEMAPTPLSKLNTFLLIGLILLVLVRSAGLAMEQVSLSVLFIFVGVVSALSGLQYVWLWGFKAWRWGRG